MKNIYIWYNTAKEVFAQLYTHRRNMKKLLIIMMLCINFHIFCKSVTFSINIPSTESNVVINKNFIEWKSFIKQYIVAYAIHYCGQTFTRILYKKNRHLADFPIAPLLSFAQAYTAFCLSYSVQELLAHDDQVKTNIWANFLGWLSAIVSEKTNY